MIPVTKPYCPDTKKLFKLIEKVHEKEWLTNFGPLHNELTLKLESYLGVENLLLVSNGTLALQIAYKALGMRDTVLTTPFSFVASSSSLIWENIKPHYVDIMKCNLNLNPDLLPQDVSDQITGILGVHVYGNPADTKSIDSYANHKKLKVVYDGAHAFGVNKNGKSILCAGDATTLSLHATKVFHTVEGGAIIFKNKDDYERAKALINFGLDVHKNIVDVGINSKLNEYQSAVGLVLMDEIESIIERRVTIFNKYYQKLKDVVELPLWDHEASLNGAYAPILLKDENELLRVQENLSGQGIQTRRYFYPSLNQIGCFNNKQECPVSENVGSRVLCLPLYTTMTTNEQDKVLTVLMSSL